jgi:hypothetical protein
MKLGHMIRHMKWQVWCLVTFFNMFTSDAFPSTQRLPESGPSEAAGLLHLLLAWTWLIFSTQGMASGTSTSLVCLALGVLVTLA